MLFKCIQKNQHSSVLPVYWFIWPFFFLPLSPFFKDILPVFEERNKKKKKEKKGIKEKDILPVSQNLSFQQIVAVQRDLLLLQVESHFLQ